MRYIDLLEKAFIVFRLPQYRKHERRKYLQRSDTYARL